MVTKYVEAQVYGSWLNEDLTRQDNVTTRLDALVEGKDGRFWIRDYKTGQARKEQRLQQVLYAVNAQDTLGFPIAGAELVYLATTDLKVDRFEWHAYEDTLATWVDQAVQGIENDVFPLSPSSFCVSCSVREACSWGRLLSEEAK